MPEIKKIAIFIVYYDAAYFERKKKPETVTVNSSGKISKQLLHLKFKYLK